MRINARLLASHSSRTPHPLPSKPPPVPVAPPPPIAPPSTSTAGPSRASIPSLLPKPRPDYARLLAAPEQTTLNHQLRASGLPLDHIAHLSRLRSTQLVLLSKLENIRRKQNEVGQMIKKGLGDRDELVRQAKKFKLRIGEYEGNLSGTEEELLDLALALPNFSSPSTPIGGEENARTIDVFGPEPGPADTRRDHLRIAEKYGLLDNDATTLASGASWLYLKGTAALLELALVNYAVSIAVKRGYTPVLPPDVVKLDLAARCGFTPRDSGGAQQTYTLSESGPGSEPTHCLAGTAEIPLAALFANRIFNANDLPLKVVGVGHAFRAEAGARGADTRGMYRVHQFTKVELFAVARGDDGDAIEGSGGDAIIAHGASDEAMNDMLETQREIITGLGLPTRMLEMPTEELGATASRKVDMEAWMPGRGKWGEITSTSNCTDYQSRRLHIRHRRPPPPPGPELASSSSTNSGSGSGSGSSDTLPFAHTLNGTAAAVPRLILALLENGARLNAEGELEGLDLPQALRPFWVGGNMVGEGEKAGEIRWV